MFIANSSNIVNKYFRNHHFNPFIAIVPIYNIQLIKLPGLKKLKVNQLIFFYLKCYIKFFCLIWYIFKAKCK